MSKKEKQAKVCEIEVPAGILTVPILNWSRYQNFVVTSYQVLTIEGAWFKLQKRKPSSSAIFRFFSEAFSLIKAHDFVLAVGLFNAVGLFDRTEYMLTYWSEIVTPMTAMLR